MTDDAFEYFRFLPIHFIEVFKRMPRGPKPAHRILLTSKELEWLRHVARLRKAPYAEVVRSKILLLAWEHPEWSNTRIAQAVGCAVRTVRKWRQRWKKGGSRTIKESERLGAPRFFSL